MSSFQNPLSLKSVNANQIFHDGVLSANFLQSVTFDTISADASSLFKEMVGIHTATQESKENNNNDNVVQDEAEVEVEQVPDEPEPEVAESQEVPVEAQSSSINTNNEQYVKLDSQESDARDGWDSDFAAVGFGNNAFVSSLERDLDIKAPEFIPKPVEIPIIDEIIEVSVVEPCNNLAGYEFNLYYSFQEYYDYYDDYYFDSYAVSAFAVDENVADGWIDLYFGFWNGDDYCNAYGSGEFVYTFEGIAFDFILNGIEGEGVIDFDNETLALDWGSESGQHFNIPTSDLDYSNFNECGKFPGGSGGLYGEFEEGCFDCVQEYDSYDEDCLSCELERTAPVVLDLDMDGLELTSVENGVLFDVDEDGVLEHTSWVSPDDALLVYDIGNNENVTNVNEFAFANWHEDANTDLEGLQLAFDTNQDGKLNSADSGWDKMGLWQDANQNGQTDDGEFLTLADVGIVELDLTLGGEAETINGNQVNGIIQATLEDGSTLNAGDVALNYSEVPPPAMPAAEMSESSEAGLM
tara:strand:- start:2414 stop:3985 length:1572 start_codon:yes stop_codon:yes gene_type:complete